MINRVKNIITLLLFCIAQLASAQQEPCTIFGIVSDSTLSPIPLVNIIFGDGESGTFSNDKGYYILSAPRDGKTLSIRFTAVGYQDHTTEITAGTDSIELNIVLTVAVTELNEVVVREQSTTEAPTLNRIPIKDIRFLPVSGSGIESLLMTLPGVISTNELSSAYTVRGGSFDENLVYINGIEIYRPQLINSGRKEGLSMLNPDLTHSVFFSPGGFNSSYGGKLSSVLDIQYRKPEEFRGSVNLGLLLSSAHLEGRSKNKRFSYLIGSRYMTNRLLLQTTDTRANYTPYYIDIQSIATLKTGKKSSLSMFFTMGNNIFQFIPLSQQSSFGNFMEAYQLYVDFDGYESDNYLTYTTALSWELNHNENFNSKLIIQNSSSNEKETYDIKGRYLLNQLDKNLGSENFGDSLMNIGVGTWLDHARNYLETNITIASFSSKWQHSRNIVSWGLKLKHEEIIDNINEWRMIDSAGYSIPFSSNGLQVKSYIKGENRLSSNRAEVYVLDNYTFSAGSLNYIFTVGARLTYWSLNDEILFSPRASMEVSPHNSLAFYFAYGRYYQSPFYKELRYPDASLNTNIRSQKSTHFVLGSRWDFMAGYTNFRLSSELYYKKLEDLIPYKFDNVRVIYAAENIASGYATGLDLRLNGEFVRDAESWLSLSFMKATHDILEDEYGPYPAPADIRFSADLFFQDYFPSNHSFKAHIKLHFSTGMPVSSPYNDRYDNIHRMPSYRRVDIGFSKTLKDRFSIISEKNPLSHFEDIVIGIEIFNLIDINNTISYNWLSTINNLSGEERQFAIPNYLTGRRLNMKISCTF
ncbi:MAG: TonB-dependent receptor [Bacteroidales bacterium]|nr:TonB-dependent receptor [Bacteroidales bacterium]